MMAIAACRLGVIFGSTLDPESITRDTTQRMGFEEGSLDARVEARKEEERFALLPGDNDNEADSLHDVLVKRFQLNIFEILQGEGPAPPVGNRDLPFVMTAIAACRLGVIFGSTLDPESITRDTTQRMGFEEGSLDARVEARKEEERFALLPGDNDRIDEGRRMDGTMRKEIVGMMKVNENREREVFEENQTLFTFLLVITF